MNLLREKQRAAGHHACFGGDSSSASNQTTNQYDQRIVLGNNSVGASAGGIVNVTTTDSGAFDLAKSATSGAFDLTKGISGLLGTQQAANRATLDSSIAASSAAFTGAAQMISNAYADAKGNGSQTNNIIFAALGIAALVAVLAFKK